VTYTTTDAAAIAHCDPLTARRIGVAMKGRGDVPMWTGTDVRHLCAAIALRDDSARNFYSEAELARITRGARHGFVQYIVVSHGKGVGVRTAEQAVERAKADHLARVIILPDTHSLAVAS
jgi:hypothetical protein